MPTLFVPSIDTADAAPKPCAKAVPCAMAAADRTAPSAPLSEASRASLDRSENFGNAVAAKMPRITITTINSISVKPCCFFIVALLIVWDQSPVCASFAHLSYATASGFLELCCQSSTINCQLQEKYALRQ